MKTLLIEDQLDWAAMVSEYVTGLGHEVQASVALKEGIDKLQAWIPDVLITDVTLPDGSAITHLPHIRSTYPRLGIILLTADVRTQGYLQGMTSGADYYLMKPLSLPILGVTMSTLERRMAHSFVPKNTIKIYKLDPVSREMFDDSGVKLRFTAKECTLLSVLIQSPRFPVHNQRMSCILGYPQSIYDQHRVDALLYRVRKKLATLPGNPFQIKSIYGSGVILSASAGYSCVLSTNSLSDGRLVSEQQ